MSRPKNVLWIMCDQLRYDYLGCTGHPTLKTPNIDAMAKRGVRFSNAYVQSPICGPSRMSFYTGRYMRSHGSHWNGWPLRVGEPTLGDHLKKIGVRNVLVGKTHMTPDLEGLKMLGIAPDSIIGVHVAECGFEPYERDDGLHPTGRPRPTYDAYLRERGYEARQSVGALGQFRRGRRRRVAERLAAGACRQGRARRGGAFRDALHDAARDGFHHRGRSRRTALVPASVLHQAALALHRAGALRQHVRRRPTCCRRCVREQEQQSAHPVFAAYMDMRYSRNMSRDEAREKVIPTYMGLIKQIDDQMGVLMQFLEARGLLDTTMIVFTSDHGDYLGDHWMGEKDLFHDASAKIPLIVIDPSRRRRRHARHGVRCAGGGDRSGADLHRLFRRQAAGSYSGRPFAAAAAARRAAFGLAQGRVLRIRLLHAGRPAEAEPADRAMPAVHGVRRPLEIHPRLRLPADALRPRMNDPQELIDRGADPACADVIARLQSALFDWALHPKGAHHHQHGEDRRLCGEATPGQERHPDRDLGRG